MGFLIELSMVSVTIHRQGHMPYIIWGNWGEYVGISGYHE